RRAGSHGPSDAPDRRDHRRALLSHGAFLVDPLVVLSGHQSIQKFVLAGLNRSHVAIAMRVRLSGNLTLGPDTRPEVELVLIRVLIANVRFGVTPGQVPLHCMNPGLILDLLNGYRVE